MIPTALGGYDLKVGIVLMRFAVEGEASDQHMNGDETE